MASLAVAEWSAALHRLSLRLSLGTSVWEPMVIAGATSLGTSVWEPMVIAGATKVGV